MAMELACGNCQGRLLVETPGVIVACPHCGIHLQTPGAPPAPPLELAPPPFVTSNVPTQPAPPPPEFPNSEVTLQMPATVQIPQPEALAVPGATETLWQPPEAPAADFGSPTLPAWEAPTEGVDTLQWSDPQSEAPAPAWLPPEDATQFSFAPPAGMESPFPDFSSAESDRTEALLPQTAIEQQAVAPSLPLEVAEVQPPAADTPPSFVLANPADDAQTQFMPQTQNFVQESSPFGANSLPPTFQELPPTMRQLPPTIPQSPEPVPDFTPPAMTAPLPSFPAPTSPVVSAPTAPAPPAQAGIVAVMADNVVLANAATSIAPDEYLSRRSGGISPQTAKLLMSYASAVTLACLYLIYLLMSVSDRQLESLPDLAPPRNKKDDQKITLIQVQVNAAMPPKHTLRLGESQRYGSLRVTPLRVTREMLEFSHYDPAVKDTKAPVGPVLKLHLQFENVSDDQTFPVFDRQLLFARGPYVIEDKKGRKRATDIWLSNNWVCQEDQKTLKGERVMVYDLPDGSWDCKGQNLEHEIAPGETFPTYIPTTPEGIDSLTGNLVWRIHFRKGYNPTTYRGVTTLIEVEFDSSEIETEPQVAAPAARPPTASAPRNV